MKNTLSACKNSLVTLSIFCANFAVAAEFLYVKGPVQQSTDGVKYSSLTPKVSVASHVQTGKDAWLIIGMKDGTRLKMIPESKLEIVKDETDFQEVKLALGGVFAEVKKRSGIKPHFSLHTKTTTMGVRGTLFFASYGKTTGEGQTDEWMCVNEGLVEVTDLTKNTSQMVKMGQGVFIEAGKGLTEPKAYEWTEKLNWSMDPKKAKVESKLDINNAYPSLRREIYD